MLYISEEDVPDRLYARDKLLDSLDKGIAISSNINDIITYLSNELHKLQSQILKETGIKNVTSDVQVRPYIFDLIKRLPQYEYIFDNLKVNNKVKLNKENLHYLSEEEGLEICSKIATARSLKHILACLRGIREKSKESRKGFVKPTLSKSKTNRFSYSNPSLFSIPKKYINYIIVPRDENKVLYSIDIKFQEPWIMIHLLKIYDLIDLISEGIDLYKAIYQLVFKEECLLDEHRTDIKKAWNAMSYGASRKRIVRCCRYLDGGYIYDYFTNIPEYQNYRNYCIHLANKKVTAIKNYFGTYVKAGEVSDFKRFGKAQTSRLSRILMDIPIQSMGADILAFLIKQIDDMNEELGTEGLIALYYTRHDELILEVDKSLANNNNMCEIFGEYFKHKVDNWLPFNVSVERIEHDMVDFGMLTEQDIKSTEEEIDTQDIWYSKYE